MFWSVPLPAPPDCEALGAPVPELAVVSVTVDDVLVHAEMTRADAPRSAAMDR
jgi:hypothetical protein